MKSLTRIFYRAAAWTGYLDLNEKLIRAAENGETENVVDYLAVGADIHAKDDLALRLAAANGHTETVRALLKAKADVHAKKDCAVRWAAEHGNDKTMKVLMEAGADIHAMDDYAFRFAARNGHIKAADILLEAGADYSALGGIARQWALERGHTAIADMIDARAETLRVIEELLESTKPGRDHIHMPLTPAGGEQQPLDVSNLTLLPPGAVPKPPFLN